MRISPSPVPQRAEELMTTTPCPQSSVVGEAPQLAILPNENSRKKKKKTHYDITYSNKQYPYPSLLNTTHAAYKSRNKRAPPVDAKHAGDAQNQNNAAYCIPYPPTKHAEIDTTLRPPPCWCCTSSNSKSKCNFASVVETQRKGTSATIRHVRADSGVGCNELVC